MPRRWFGITWGARTESDEHRDRGSTAPHHFMLEYWKFYEGYMQRKEHLVEAAITAYSALAVLLLTRSERTWQDHGIWLVVFGVIAAIIVEQFIYAEFQHWQSGVKLSIASQRVAADWLSKPKVAAEELAAVTSPDALGVRIPRALATELDTIQFSVPKGFFRGLHIACSGGPFAKIAYRFILLWWVAFVVRGAMTRTS